MFKSEVQFTFHNNVYDFLGETKIYRTEENENSEQIETDYSWDWENDPQVSALLVREWKYLNDALTSKLELNGSSILVVGGGGKHFFDEITFPTDIKTLYILNPTMEELIETPVSRFSDIKVFLLRGIAEENPLADQMVDAVIISSTLDHVIDPKLTLSEAIRVLNPNGQVGITLGNHESWYRNLAKTLNIEKKEDHAHRYHFSIPDVVKLLEQAGFRDVMFCSTAYLRIPRFFEKGIVKLHLVKVAIYLSNRVLSKIFGNSSGGMFAVWASKSQ